MDELMCAAVEAVTVAMAGAFDEIWTRPNAAQTMAAFLDGTVRFVVGHDGVQVLAAGPAGTDPPPDTPVGLYM
jgi:hypothetical protein